MSDYIARTYLKLLSFLCKSQFYEIIEFNVGYYTSLRIT